MEREDIQLIGDHRDIPLSLGMIVVSWNACEVGLRHMLRTLASGGDASRASLSEILVSELNSVGISQALSCYAEEFPADASDIAAALKNASAVLDRCRAYRNYYVHGINGVTQRGMFFSDEDFQNNTPAWELMREGPFGYVYSKSAKRELRFFTHFIDREALIKFGNYLSDFNDFIRALDLSVIHFFRYLDYRSTAPVPGLLDILADVQKPIIRHGVWNERRAFDRERLGLPRPSKLPRAMVTFLDRAKGRLAGWLERLRNPA